MTDDPYNLPPWVKRKFEEGDLASVMIGGTVYTDYITAVNPKPPRQPWWRRLIRTLTPKWWRKPIKESDPLKRHQQLIADAQDAIKVLTHNDGPTYELGRDITLGELHTWCTKCFRLHPAGKHVETGDTAE